MTLLPLVWLRRASTSCLHRRVHGDRSFDLSQDLLESYGQRRMCKENKQRFFTLSLTLSRQGRERLRGSLHSSLRPSTSLGPLGLFTTACVGAGFPCPERWAREPRPYKNRLSTNILQIRMQSAKIKKSKGKPIRRLLLRPNGLIAMTGGGVLSRWIGPIQLTPCYALSLLLPWV